MEGPSNRIQYYWLICIVFQLVLLPKLSHQAPGVLEISNASQVVTPSQKQSSPSDEVEPIALKENRPLDEAPQVKAPINKRHQILPNNADKLKRGLTNFMNQLNPAPFFVPNTILPASLAGKASSGASSSQPGQPSSNPPLSAEPAAIVSADTSAEALMKGSQRSHRPIGSSWRWGRRR